MVLPLNVLLWCIREVLALREELPQKPIGILVGPAFPWMVRSRKVERHTLQFLAELSMFREFLSAIWRDRKMRLPRECLTHHLIDSNGGLARGLSTKQVPALPIHQRDEACLSLLAHHGIRFPVTTDGTVRRTGRTILDGMRYDELATMFFAAFLVTPFPCCASADGQSP